ncbi:multiple C2 and transmembrane domain-containing protein 1-like isoform X2 [Physella acuta]|uniref:multiple C2 and transmembrane domain-containing protein 1-like isoform X2 n=1 Tax=Physella acuta TaxID=109671 RepID=UPI0027DBF1DD|nr:multiple C2 and transmembrane domain-containing protein 1-like isoform X2 [Physella acuta]
MSAAVTSKNGGFAPEFQEIQIPEHLSRSKRRTLKKLKSLSSPDTSRVTSDPPVIMSADLEVPTSGEPPPAGKTKHRIKLWDSFLSKTKNMRIRKKEKHPKLKRRSSSQPNIPITSRNKPAGEGINKSLPVSNGNDAEDSTDSRRARLKHQKELRTSASSLAESPSKMSSGADHLQQTSPVSMQDTESFSYQSYSEISNNQPSITDPTLTLDQEGQGSVDDTYSQLGRGASVDKEDLEYDDDDERYKENEEAEDDVPVLVQSSLSKSTRSHRSRLEERLIKPVITSADRPKHGAYRAVSFRPSEQLDDGSRDQSDDESCSDDYETADEDPGSGPLGHQLQQHSFFVLHVHLKEGKDLVIRDSCGTSDPYVKFKIGGKLLYKSRTIYKNLNPKWDEQFSIHIEDITKPINIKVFDYDRAWNDDPMGGVDIDVTTLEVNKATELKLLLTERGNTEYMGYLILNCTLSPKTNEDKEQLFRRSTRSTESATASKKLKMQLWNGVVNIILVEGSNLVSMDDNGLSDPYVKFKLGTEKYRSKFKSKTLNPRWLEQFDLRLFDDQTALLEISVYDHDTRGKDDFMGRAVIDLSQLERERTHTIVQPLEDGAGTIKLLLTVSGTFGGELTSDLANYTPNPLDKDNIVSKYGLLNSLRNIDDIGHLEVKVFRAHGLQSADFGGLSDPFCVIELINDRVQTQTEYKTLNPEWAKVFTFNVKDIHSVLEVTVYDEDRNKKVEFLGKVAIPLLRIKNGERRWYALKDRKTLHKTKGAILLEMDMVYNHLKAAIRTVNPKEEKLMLPDQKFKISTMKQNINRVSQIIGVFIDTGRFIQSCFDWQSPPRTITAFIVYLVAVWNFELYMLPISLLLIFIKNLVIAQIVGSFKKEPVEDDYFVEDEDDDEDEKDKQEEKKSIVDRYHAIQEVCLQVQQGLDTVACLGERVKNTFNWSVPWLSALAVIALSAGIIVLYYIPLRYLLLAWGINKFTKKLRKPNAISNNELLDFLSRIPSDNELLQYRELRPDIPANTTSSKKKRA